jgi:RNA polymerase sigma factor (TIGR02999 family)
MAAVIALSDDKAAYTAFCNWIVLQPTENLEMAERAIKVCLLRADGIDLAALQTEALTGPLDEGYTVCRVLRTLLSPFWYNRVCPVFLRRSPLSHVTHILSQIESGDPSAAEQLLPFVYEELRKLAAARLEQEKPGQTLQATALVHEAYILLVDGEQAQNWDSRGHFFAAAAESMRRILVNNALRKRRPKHGHQLQRVDLDGCLTVSDSPNDEILALNEALTRLAEVDKTAAEVVKLKYFTGLTIPQIAEFLNISSRTADRRWAYARAWLHQELCGE